jgi:uncharacterized membrane protein YsdA (DUF1294 family)
MIIAGRITPANATTIAMVAGAVGMKIMKKIIRHKIKLFKNSFMNLAFPFYVFFNPSPSI